jgi:hypothetical protein
MKLASTLCNCGKASPGFNEPNEITPICCVSCKTDTMIDVKNKKCKCNKAPHFNEPGNNNGVCCASCKTDTMIDITNKKCKCNKVPVYNEPGETKPICCASCKTNTMINIKHKKCKCNKFPSYNEIGKTTPICCLNCKTDSMINVVNKRCKCNKFPSYNEIGKTTPICCLNCKTDSMINVLNKRCKCGISHLSFNEPGNNKGICCASCKTDTMIDVVHKKCKCGKVNPCFNVFNEKTSICCSSCKTENMIDIRNKNQKCPGNILTGCPYNSKGNIKYKKYCTECFRREFPLDPLTFQIRSKTKEIAVRDFINSVFNGFQHDKILETGHCDCTIRRRIDHRKLIGNTLLVIETDENQHKKYETMNEETRYDDLFMAYSGKWIYIRFNPDKYKDKFGKNKNPAIATRLEALKTEIEKQIKRIENEENKELVERVYMFYDEVN